MKKILLILSLFVCGYANAENPIAKNAKLYQEFEFGDSMNWDDCFNFSQGPGPMEICPMFPVSYMVPTWEYRYNEPVALVEVVPDPWQSFLYKESFYDFSSRNPEKALASSVGVVGTMGAGYGNQKQQNSGKEFIGKQRLEGHVWAVSDIWRLKTSSPFDACLSFTCKFEDMFGCRKIGQSSFSVSSSVKNTAASINSGQEVEGKGQGVTDSETGDVHYEDGSVYTREKDENGDYTGRYIESRPAGNYGAGGQFSSAGTSVTSADVPGEAGAKNNMNSAASNDFSEAGSSSSIGMDHSRNGKIEAGRTIGRAANTDASLFQNGSASSLPNDTKKGASSPGESSPLSSASGNSSSVGNQVSDNAMGNNSAGNVQARNQMNQMAGSNGLNQVLSVIDRVTYFNPIEQMIQMIATKAPVLVHPVFMTERHKKAAVDGGFFWAPIYQGFAGQGAGLIMPMFCMSKTLGMGLSGGMDMLGVDIPTDMLSGAGSFLGSRCIGSWGPLEPRVNMIGTGDAMVGAGIASIRALNIAQNITGDQYNQTINNTPFAQLKFNLEWPHQSSCYSFQGFSGLSRAWTTPVAGMLDSNSLMDAVKGKNMSSVAKSSPVGDINKQGGYVFTYWRKRVCRKLLGCRTRKWAGDTRSI